jgi:hypothetical protein
MLGKWVPTTPCEKLQQTTKATEMFVLWLVLAALVGGIVFCLEMGTPTQQDVSGTQLEGDY